MLFTTVRPKIRSDLAVFIYPSKLFANYFLRNLDGWDYFKVCENSKVVNKTIYLTVGLRRDGRKELLGMWLVRTESSGFWMSVLTDMKARVFEDILITATDNLNGFT